MYTKEQEEIALKEYKRMGSVHAVIRRLGYPSKSTLYRWYERRNAGPENRHGHAAEIPEKFSIHFTGCIIQFEMINGVSSVVDDIGIISLVCLGRFSRWCKFIC